MKASGIKIPRSCTLMYLNFFGVAGYLIAIFSMKLKVTDTFLATVISIAAMALPIMILEKIFLRREHAKSSGICFSVRNKLKAGRIIVKLIGLYATLGIIALFYWLFPEYQTGTYENYLRLAKNLLIIIVAGSIPYFIILDSYMTNPKDGYWHAGMFFLGKWRKVDKFQLKNHFLGWMVKAFFLALMFSFLINNTQYLIFSDFPTNFKNNFQWYYEYLTMLFFSIDLVWVCAGYLLTLRIFDSHIRTAEPSVLGWIVALACYQPFWSFFSSNYLPYEDNYNWINLLGHYPVWHKIYGMVILALLAIYVLATVAFGLRFSNLTNRGIITNGPYRFMKHPAYISKNLTWWMISVPFLSEASSFQALAHCLMLLALNFIYYVRAVTEERHLSLDPVYVQYAEAMNEKGMFRWLYKLIPFLKYSREKYIKNGTFKPFYLTLKPSFKEQ